MTEFTKRCLDVIKNIPAGKVATYGQIAALAGNSRGARQVSRILHSMSDKHGLPWHRVINSKGEISLTGELRDIQRSILLGEGVAIGPNNKIDLKEFQMK